MMNVGDEVDGKHAPMRLVLLVEGVRADVDAACEICALNAPREDVCRTGEHPMDCTKHGVRNRPIAVYVKDIPRLAVKGWLA